jgi:YcxB-like protein
LTEPLALRFTYTEDDYVKAVRLRNRKRGGRWLDVAAGVGAIAFGGVTWALEGFSALRLTLVVLGLVFLGMIVAADFVLPRVWFRREAKFQDEYTLTFKDEGVDFHTSRIHSLVEWSFYEALIEGPETFLLTYGRNQFSAIPKRVFENAEQEARFREFVTAKLAANQAPPS